MTRAALVQAVLDQLTSPEHDATDLFLAIHRYQHAHDPVVRALLPEPATTLDAIPAVPVGLFRDLAVGTVRPTEPHTAFHTSGTTVGQPGVRRSRDTMLYDAGCRLHAAAWIPTATTRTLGLMHDNPHSSLAHMVRGFADRTGPVTFLVKGDTIDFEPLDTLTEPAFVCTTAFALDAWLATSPAPLPAGSRILVTGGFKGRKTTLDATSVVTHAERLASVVQEYGMTELSSQLWSLPGDPFVPPHWLRVTAVDPLTGQTLAPGEVGQLRFLDLCNVDSTLHIETMDQGSVDERGHVTLHGRLSDAPARGCSLAVEDLV